MSIYERPDPASLIDLHMRVPASWAAELTLFAASHGAWVARSSPEIRGQVEYVGTPEGRLGYRSAYTSCIRDERTAELFPAITTDNMRDYAHDQAINPQMAARTFSVIRQTLGYRLPVEGIVVGVVVGAPDRHWCDQQSGFRIDMLRTTQQTVRDRHRYTRGLMNAPRILGFFHSLVDTVLILPVENTIQPSNHKD